VVAIWFGLGYYNYWSKEALPMDDVTSKDADDAIEVLSRFLRDSLDIEAKDVPDIDYVKVAIAALIIWNNFDETDYEIQNLIRVFESKKAISYADLNSQLKDFVPYAIQLREIQKARSVLGEPSPDDLF
jgi:hypothetical protein